MEINAHSIIVPENSASATNPNPRPCRVRHVQVHVTEEPAGRHGYRSCQFPLMVVTSRFEVRRLSLVFALLLASCGGGAASEPVLLSAETVRRRIPVPSDVSSDWTDDGEPLTRDLTREEGPFVGVCGGPTFTGLAMDHGVEHVVRSARFWTAEGSYGSVIVMTFPSEENASSMITSVPTECAIGPSDVPESVVQTVGGGDDDDDAGTWQVTESSTTFAPRESDADERLGMVYVTSIDSADTCGDEDCGWDSTDVRTIDRYGNLVIMTSLWGRENLRGFSNNEGATIPAATPDDVQVVAEKYVPALLDRLTGQQES